MKIINDKNEKILLIKFKIKFIIKFKIKLNTKLVDTKY